MFQANYNNRTLGKWQLTAVFFPGESQGQMSPIGPQRVGHG